jgi:hypothetical protein
MDVKRPGGPIIGSALELIAQRLRSDGDNVARQSLPKRWVELLQHLNEEERRDAAGAKPPKARSGEPGVRIDDDPEASS